MKIYKSIVLSFFCALSFVGRAQTIRHLGTENGLSNGFVRAIAQDGHGFMWFATEYGLNMYDGSRFFVFNQQNSAVESNLFTSLLYTPTDSLLWVGTDNGLFVVNHDTRVFSRFDGVPKNMISSLCPAADGGVWVVYLYDMLVHIAPGTYEITNYSASDTKGLGYSFRTIYDAGNMLYIGYAGDGFGILDIKKRSVRNFSPNPNNPAALPGGNVYHIFKDSRGHIWLGTNNGLSVFSQSEESFVTFRHDASDRYSLNSNHIYNIGEHDGRLWVCSDVGGVNIAGMDDMADLMANRQIRFYDISDFYTKGKLTSLSTRNLFVDSFGNIWIGDWSFGIYVIGHIKDIFSKVAYTYTGSEPAKALPAWAIASDHAGGAWIGGENQFAHCSGGVVTDIVDITPYVTRTFSRVQSIADDHGKGLYVGLFDDGLLYYNRTTHAVSRIKLYEDYLDINTIYQDNDGTYLIGTESGIYRITGTSARRIEIDHEGGSATPSVFGMARDKDGKLWCGTYGEGIVILDSKDRFVKQVMAHEGQLSTISDLIKDSRGRIWASSRKGLIVFDDATDPESYEVLDDRMGLGELDLRTVIEDAKGDIWVASNSMISKWNVQKQRFENFDYHQGIPMGNFGNGCSDMLTDGTLMFGTLGGACCFNPAVNMPQIEKTTLHPKISHIECLNADEQKMLRCTISNSLCDVPYDIGVLKIQFSVPDYSLSNTLDYSYCIEGITDDWTTTADENVITLHSLQPGNYVLRIRTKLKNEEWNDANSCCIRIVVRPPFWQTWWAYLIYILVLCAVGYLILRAYRRRINLETSLKIEKEQSENVRHLNEERLRFFTNVAHELRTPLTLILGPLEDMADDTSLQPAHHKHVESVLGSARQLGRLINQILEFRKTETQNRRLTVSRGSLSDLVTETILPYKDTKAFGDGNVEFVCDIEKGIDNIFFDRDIITITINNLLSNAFKYTPSGQVRFSLKSVEHTVVITVSDTGYGIREEALPHIFDRYYQADGKHQASGTGIGLALVASLIKIHHGTIDVTSEEGKGTTFTVTLPTDEQYPDAIHKDTDIEPQNHITAEPQNRLMLIVEDNAEVRQYIADTFLQQGFSIIQASNGREGAEQAFINVPDIIISDVMMPEMNGFELLGMLKGDVRTSHIPIILLTAKDTMEDREEGYLSGADSYITKPFTAKLIRSRVENLLASRKVWADYILRFPHASWEQTATTPVAAEDVLPPRENQFVEKLNNLIMQNIDAADLDISFLTDNLGMSHSTCYRKIKGLTGLSPNEYVRRMRLSKAAEMLKSSNMNISEISYACGFSSPSYFRTCFKEIYNMTPKEYATRK